MLHVPVLTNWVWTAIRHSQVGQPSVPHLYPSWQVLGQEKELVHCTACGLFTSVTWSPTTNKTDKCL